MDFEREVLENEGDNVATRLLGGLKQGGAGLKSKFGDMTQKIKNIDTKEQGKTFQVIIGKVVKFVKEWSTKIWTGLSKFLQLG